MIVTQREILQEFNRRFVDKNLTPFDALFDKQRKYFLDNHKRKAALTSRRAGKSRLAATLLLEKTPLLKEGSNPYVAQTRDSAKRIMWNVLTSLIEQFKVDCEPVESALTIKFPKTKSDIFIVGADQKNFIGRLRGIKSNCAIIDETQNFGEHISELVESVLEPTLAESNGELHLFGTPGITPKGYYHTKTTESSEFSIHNWTILDNPYFPNPKEYLEKLLKSKSWSEEHPTYQREWLGRWVRDLDALLMKFDSQRNTYRALPGNLEWLHVIGVDLGWHDKTAFTVFAYSERSPKLYIVHSESASHLIPSKIAERLKTLIERYDPTNIVADTGGLGKSIVEEFRQRYHIPIEAAEKRDKLTAIELMNGDFISGNLYVHESCRELIDQLEKTPKGDNGLEHSDFVTDEIDSSLYAMRRAKHFTYRPKEPVISRDSEEWLDLLAEREANKMRLQASGDWLGDD